MGFMVLKLQSLSSSMGTLESRMHTTGVTLDGMIFASDEEFATWFMSHNPQRLCMAAFVDIISIWTFLNTSQTSAEWLSMLEKSAKLGFGPLDTAYIHSMTYKYPPKFAGKASVILSTEHIKMLKSMNFAHTTSCACRPRCACTPCFARIIRFFSRRRFACRLYFACRPHCARRSCFTHWPLCARRLRCFYTPRFVRIPCLARWRSCGRRPCCDTDLVELAGLIWLSRLVALADLVLIA